MIDALKVFRQLWKALRADHSLIMIAVLDDHTMMMRPNNISVEAIAPVLDIAVKEAIEQGTMTERMSLAEINIEEQRKAEYEEKRKRGEL